MLGKMIGTMNQEFKAIGTKYQVLSNFGICCWELAGLKVTSFRACVRSFCSVYLSFVIGFGQLCQIYSNKPPNFMFSKTILNVGRARAAIVDFAKYIYHRLGT